MLRPIDVLEKLNLIYEAFKTPLYTSRQHIAITYGVGNIFVKVLTEKGLMKKTNSSGKYRAGEYVWSSTVRPNIKMASAVLEEYRKQFKEYKKKRKGPVLLPHCNQYPNYHEMRAGGFQNRVDITSATADIKEKKLLNFSTHALTPNIIDMLNDIEIVQCVSVDGKNFQLTIKGHL